MWIRLGIHSCKWGCMGFRVQGPNYCWGLRYQEPFRMQYVGPPTPLLEPFPEILHPPPEGPKYITGHHIICYCCYQEPCMTLVYKGTTVFNVKGSWGHACLHVLSINHTHPSYLASASVPSQQTIGGGWVWGF